MEKKLIPVKGRAFTPTPPPSFEVVILQYSEETREKY